MGQLDTPLKPTLENDTQVGELCAELDVTRQTLYRHVTPQGELRPGGLSAAGPAKTFKRVVKGAKLRADREILLARRGWF